MRKTIVLLSLALLLTVSAAVSASTYERRLAGLEGYYNIGERLRSDGFDFGSTFTIINSIGVRIVGQATDSQDWMLVPDPMDPYAAPNYTIMHMPVQFSAGIPTADQSFYGAAAMGFFDMLIPTTGPTESVRRDGFGNVELYCYIPQMNGPAGFATVEQAYVVVDGELASVPEPASLLTLGSGMLALAGMIIRKRGR